MAGFSLAEVAARRWPTLVTRRLSPFSHGPKRTVWRGGRISSRPFSNAICRRVWGLPPPLCALLDDAGALSRPNLERCRTCALVWDQRGDRAALPGYSGGSVYGASIPTWHANMKKRQVKSPKIYFRDTGFCIICSASVRQQDLLDIPKSARRGRAMPSKRRSRRLAPDEAYFWATHAGAELDLLLIKRSTVRRGVQARGCAAPDAFDADRAGGSELERIAVVYPGTRRLSLGGAGRGGSAGCGGGWDGGVVFRWMIIW